MRTVSMLVLTVLLAIASGCTMTPGQSPAQLSAAHDSSAYQARDFNGMHPEIP